MGIFYIQYLKGAHMRFFNLILLSGSISLLFAQPQQAKSLAAAQPAAKVAPVTAQKLMEGMLVSVDASKQTFVIKLRGTDYAFIANKNTDVTAPNNSKNFADLVPGRGARATYIRDNSSNRVALTISQDIAVTPAKAKPVSKPASAQAVKAKVKQAPAAAAPAKAAQQAPQAVKPAPAQTAAPAAKAPEAAAPAKAAPAAAAQQVPPAQQAPQAVKPASAK